MDSNGCVVWEVIMSSKIMREKRITEIVFFIAFSDKINDLMQIRSKVEHKLRNALNVGVSVELVEPGSLPRFEGKSKKVIDRRNL